MKLTVGDKEIQTFAIAPRTLDKAEYWENIRSVSKWCADYRLTGPLLFTGNDTFVEPWVCAQAMIAEYGVAPLVAVNPIYAHPFTVAKMISSYSLVYEKQIFLNMVTGACVKQHAALADEIDHDEKYDRLLEFIQIVQGLTENSPAPLTYEGKYYQVKDLRLNPPVPKELLPGYFVAGHSDKAQEIKALTGAVGMQMLPPKPDQLPEGVQGIHFGIMTRRTEEEVWDAAHKRFPESERGKFVLEQSMKRTDSVWKKRLKFMADTEDVCENGYWLAPFRNFQADCPYFIGSHERVKDLVVGLVRSGIENIILDVPGEEQEFAEVATAFQMAEQELADTANMTAAAVAK